MITRILRLVCAFCHFFIVARQWPGAPAQSEWLKALRDGGYVIIFRHGATYQDQADTDPLNPKNVLKQRLSDEAARSQKRLEGRCKLRILLARFTSLFQRAIDTGALMGFGDVTVSADYTEGGLVVTDREQPAHRRVAQIASAMPPPAPMSSSSRINRTSWMLSAKDWFDVREGEAWCSSRTATAATNRSPGSRPVTGASSHRL